MRVGEREGKPERGSEGEERKLDADGGGYRAKAGQNEFSWYFGNFKYGEGKNGNPPLFVIIFFYF